MKQSVARIAALNPQYLYLTHFGAIDATEQAFEQLVMLTDLYATLLEASGAPPAADRAYDSLSLFKPADAGRKLYWRSDFNRALRHGRWKLVEDTRAGLVQLYDLEADPGETKNLAASNTALVEKLRSTLDHWELEMASPGWPRVMNYRYQDELGEYWFAI